MNVRPVNNNILYNTETELYKSYRYIKHICGHEYSTTCINYKTNKMCIYYIGINQCKLNKPFQWKININKLG